MKKLMMIITTLIIALTGMVSVSATSNPSSINATSMGKYNYDGEYYSSIKYTPEGVVAYCIEYKKYVPMGHVMMHPTKVDNGLLYILDHGYKGTVDELKNSEQKRKEYYTTQLAIHTYLGQISPIGDSEIHSKVWDLVNGAKKAQDYSEKLSMSLTSNSDQMTLNGDYFVSSPIKVNVNKSGSYAVGASENVNAQVVDANGNVVSTVKSGDTVYLRMPQSSISEGQTATVHMTVSGSTNMKTAYAYYPCDSTIQPMLYAKVYTQAISASANFSAKAVKAAAPKVTEVIVSKKDINTKAELAGATLVIKDATGKTVATIKTDGTAKKVEGLKAGFYTLSETEAPAGYVLSDEEIKFEVKEGQVSKVIFYNELEEVKEEAKKEQVKISKQDIATKTELPGATLVIKDATGKEIKRWVSTETAVYFELEAGTYTLEEIQAPAGYVLSTEKIEFTVNELGEVDKEVIMYNTKEVDVPITAANASMLMYGIGLFGMMFGYKKIVKNA